jgi:hypothetical protein
VPRAEGGDADADEEPGMVAVQTALLHHVIGDLARGSAAVELESTLSARAAGAATAMTLSGANTRTRPVSSDRAGLIKRTRVVVLSHPVR